MNAHDENRMKQLLQQALPRVEGNSATDHDLWPVMLQRLHARPAVSPFNSWASLDWVLLAGILAFVAAFPASISVLAYCL